MGRWGRLCAWLARQRLVWALARARRAALSCSRRAQLMEVRGALHAAAVERRAQEIEALQGRWQAMVAEAARVQRQYDATLAELREKNMVLEDTITTLVASNRLLLARYEADVAVQVRMREAASGGGGSGIE